MLVKGRGNYVSLRRQVHAAERAGSLFHSEEEFEHLRDLALWAKETATARWPICRSSAQLCLGRGGQRQRELPGPAMPDV